MELNYRDIMKLSTKDDHDWRVTGKFKAEEWPRQNAHTGVDFGMDVGTPIYAMADMEVVAENFGINFTTLKNTGKLANDYGNWTMYYVSSLNRTYMDAHTQFKASKVSVGDKLKKGDLITLSGNTGMSSGPHLHRSVAVGRHTTLQSLFANGRNFLTDMPDVKEDPIVPVEPGFEPYDTVIPAGSYLYSRSGVQYEKATSKPHTVRVYEEFNGLKGFSAGWLDGVSVAYFKTPDTVVEKPVEKPVEAPTYTNRVGSTVTIARSALLYNSNRVAYDLRVNNDHVITVIDQIGNGIDGSTLLMFKANWLIGVSTAYVRLENVR